MNGLLLSLLLFSFISVVSIVAFSPYIFSKNKPENSPEIMETTIIETCIPQISSTENEIEEATEKTEEATPSDETGNEKIIWDFLKDNGLTDAGAAGLMGNLYAESTLKSVIYENSYKKALD